MISHSGDIQINKNQKEILGNVYLRWTNYLCESADIWSPPVIFDKTGNELDLSVVDAPKTLILEVPVWIKCSLVNQSGTPLNLILDIDDKAQSIKIHGLTKFKIGILNHNNVIHFGALVFPQDIGV